MSLIAPLALAAALLTAGSWGRGGGGGAAAPQPLRIAGMYITQGTQRSDFSVPLVANRDGYLRVFVVADRPGSALPQVRVTLRNAAGTAVLAQTIDAPGPAIPTTIQEDDLTSSWNLPVPGNLIQPGSTLRAEQLLYGGGAPNSLNPAFPPGPAPMPLDVRTAPPLGITLFPVVSCGRVGNVNTGGRTLASWTDRIARIYPVSNIDLQAGAPFSTTTVLGTDILDYVDVRNQLEAKRLADDPGNLRYCSGSIPFDPQEEEDLPAGVDCRSFAFVIPMTPALQNGLASLKVTGGGLSASLRSASAGAPRPLVARQPMAKAWRPGVVNVSWDSGIHRQVMVRDPRTGLIVGMGEGGSLDLTSDATELELLLSDGVRTRGGRLQVMP